MTPDELAAVKARVKAKMGKVPGNPTTMTAPITPNPFAASKLPAPTAPQPITTPLAYQCGCPVVPGKLKGTACQECRAKAHQMAAQARSDRRDKKRADVLGKVAPGAGNGRLPDGAQFTANYSELLQCWTGLLAIPEGDGHRCFSALGSGIVKLLFALDAQYRESLVATTPPLTEGEA